MWKWFFGPSGVALGPHLLPPEVGVTPRLVEQFVVGPSLDHPTLLQDQDLVHGFEPGQTVGDEDERVSDGHVQEIGRERVGGRRLEVTSNTAAAQRFDPKADRWTQLPAAPGKVSDAGAAIVGGRLIVAGGESIGTVFSTVWAYDLASSTWSVLPNLAQPRHGLAIAAIGNTLYAIDGASQPGHNASTPTVQTLTFHN